MMHTEGRAHAGALGGSHGRASGLLRRPPSARRLSSDPYEART